MANILHGDLEIVGDGIDYISTMPDEILCKILSNFDMKSVIRTRVLSKRWKRLDPFNVPPIIKLDFSQCFNLECRCYNDQCSLSFIDFVDNLLYKTLRDGPSVESVFLSWCGKPYDGDDKEMQEKIDKENVDKFLGWVNAVLRLNVRNLTLGFLGALKSSIKRRDSRDIFRSLNGCETLVELNLKGRWEVEEEVEEVEEEEEEVGVDDRIDLWVPREFTLPNLKSLFLYSFVFGETINSLIGGCPMLNELYFSRVMFADTFRIRSRLLKIFVLKSCRFWDGIAVVFDAPNLEVLVYDCDDDVIPDWIRADFKYLHSAYIGIGHSNHDNQFHLSELYNIVKSCSNATRLCLYLGRDQIEDFLTTYFQVTVFRNLTWLGIMKMGNTEFEALARFLNNVPTIQTLKLSIHGDTLGCYARFESLLPTVPISLRKIEILNYVQEVDVVNLAKYLLKNGRGVQKVTLCYDKRSLEKRLLTYRKPSGTTQVIIKKYKEDRYGCELLRKCLSFSDSYDKIAAGFMY